ncbi:hypothetical protein ACFW1K_10990 [Streptomyces tendae]
MWSGGIWRNRSTSPAW